MKFKLHPLFFALVLVLILTGQALNLVWALIALVLHESGHAAMARLRGFTVKSLVIMPYGAMMSLDERFDRASAALIGISGPAVNAIAALVLLGVWWLFPAAYPVTQPFLYANLSLGLFNLLPAYPLDGARIALGLSKNRLRAIKGLQIAGIALSMAFFALFIVSFFFKFNITLGVIAVFLFYGAAFGTRGETYLSVLDSACKNYALGVEKRVVKISKDAPLVRLYHHVGSAYETTFEVLDENGVAIYILDEEGLKALAVKNRLSALVGDALAGKGKAYEPYAHTRFSGGMRKHSRERKKKRARQQNAGG